MTIKVAIFWGLLTIGSGLLLYGTFGPFLAAPLAAVRRLPRKRTARLPERTVRRLMRRSRRRGDEWQWSHELHAAGIHSDFIAAEWLRNHEGEHQ